MSVPSPRAVEPARSASPQAHLEDIERLLAKHKLDIHIPADLPAPVADATLLQRVFVSLISNTAKHTPPGTTVVISARKVGEAIEVSVEDNGPGLPAGREEEVFESFARGETRSMRRGAGLGLAISRAILSAHGGEIHAESGREKGARFVFTLPLAPPKK